MSLAARVAAIVADGIALIVTWKHTISNVREASRLHISVPLGEALARDGELRIFLRSFLNVNCTDVFILLQVHFYSCRSNLQFISPKLAT